MVILTFWIFYCNNCNNCNSKYHDRFLKGYFNNVAEQLNVDKTSYDLLRRIIVAIIILGGVSVAPYLIPLVRSISISLFTGAGFAGIVIGFAVQKTVSNHNEYGSVEDITLYHTVIKTWENKRLVLPNSIISDETIVNWSIRELPVLWHVDFGIS
ncbi:MAG: mechanosensitive ion channel [Halobacteriota archaeon]|nr:mechanosensitive ion channel [Halobacteriota archaeon]